MDHVLRVHAPAVVPGRRHRWKVLGVGVVANASFAAVFSGIPATAVLMRSGYRIGNAELGFVLGMLGLGIVVSELPWGLLTDRWGDRRVLLTGLVSTALALAAMALFGTPSHGAVPSVSMLAGGLVVVGLLGGSVNGSSGRAVMAWFGPAERGLAMSIRQTAVPTGAGLGALALPPLAAHGGYAWVYGVLAASCAVCALLAACWLHEPPSEGAGAPTMLDGNLPQPGDSPPYRDARIVRLALGIGALCMPQVAVISFASVFLHDVGHLGLTVIGALLATVQTGAAITRVWSGRWTDRRGNRRAYLRGCGVLTLVLFALLALASASERHDHAAMLIVCAALLVTGGIAASAWHGVAYTELATLAGQRHVGTALAMGNTGAFLAFWVAPSAVPLLLTLGAWPLVWAAASACALLAIVLFPRAGTAARGLRGCSSTRMLNESNV